MDDPPLIEECDKVELIKSSKGLLNNSGKDKSMSAKVKWLGLIFLTLIFILPFHAAGAEETEPTPDPVALVNGKAITRQAYLNNLNRLMQKYRQRGQELNGERLEKVKKEAFDGLINQELLFQESRKAGIHVEKSAVKEHLAGFKQQFPTAEAFQKALRDRGLTEAALESEIEKGFAIRKFVQERIIGKIVIQESETQAFYDANPKLFLQPEMVRASHILIKVEEGADESQKAAAEKKITTIQQKIKNGDSFEELARRFSEGPSGVNGGDLGFFRRGQMVAPFEQAAFALQPGEVSDKVVTRFGYHLIKVTAKKDARTVSYQEAKENIARHLRQVKTNQEIQRYIETLRRSARVEKISALD